MKKTDKIEAILREFIKELNNNKNYKLITLNSKE